MKTNNTSSDIPLSAAVTKRGEVRFAVVLHYISAVSRWAYEYDPDMQIWNTNMEIGISGQEDIM